jgi:hypothetical protein
MTTTITDTNERETMTENTIEDTAADDVTPPTPEVPAEEQDDNASGNREAAKYRRQLRETEAERDGLSAKLEQAHRRIADTMLGNVPSGAFWQMHPDVDDLRGEDGHLDPDKVAEAAQAVHTALGLPGPFSNTPKGVIGPYVPSEGAFPDHPLSGDSWSDAFTPKA